MSGAIRLTFEYRGRDVELVSSEPVDVVVPGGAVEPTEEERSGFWVDLLDARGRRIHSRPLHNPIPDHAEFAHADPDRPFTNVPIPEPSGRFFVLVPALEDIAEVELMGTDPERRGG